MSGTLPYSQHETVQGNLPLSLEFQMVETAIDSCTPATGESDIYVPKSPLHLLFHLLFNELCQLELFLPFDGLLAITVSAA